MSSKEPRPLPKYGEPHYRDPSKPRVVNQPPPPKRYDTTRSQVVSLAESQNRLARSDERKRMLLERVLRALDGIEDRYELLISDIRAELGRG